MCVLLKSILQGILTRHRKRLEHDDEKLASSKVDPNQQIGDVQELDVDTNSITQIEVPPWSESYELSSTDVDGTGSASGISVSYLIPLLYLQTNWEKRSWMTNIGASDTSLNQGTSSRP